ncbi:MAG: hypothetical protein Aureis2KO_17060 [Aureisphaera sp.]
MKKIFGILLIYVILGVTYAILFSIYLSFSSLPGGEVGMMPILILMVCAITIVISTIILLLLKLFKYNLSYTKAVVLFFIVYFLLVGYEVVENLIEDWNDPYVQINISLIVIALILWFASMLITRRLDLNMTIESATKKDGS